MRTLFDGRVIALCAVLGLGLGACRRAEAPPELGALPAFSMTDQAGRGVSADSFRGKPWVAAFMFTRCPTVCPKITAQMKTLQAEAKRREIDVRFVSISVDPEHDTPEVLTKYAAQNGLDLSSWSLLTGDSESIKATAENGFKIGVEGRADAAAEHYGITHGSHLVLVDGDLKIRGYYRSSDDEQMKKLLDDAEALAR